MLIVVVQVRTPAVVVQVHVARAVAIVLSGTPEVGGLAYTVEEAFDRGAIASREGRKTIGVGGTFLIIFN